MSELILTGVLYFILIGSLLTLGVIHALETYKHYKKSRYRKIAAKRKTPASKLEE